MNITKLLMRKAPRKFLPDPKQIVLIGGFDEPNRPGRVSASGQYGNTEVKMDSGLLGGMLGIINNSLSIRFAPFIVGG